MKKIIYGLVFILLAATVTAANVCVVVDYGNDNVDSECVDVADNADGKEVLDATGFNVEWTSDTMWGQMACRINGIGTDVDGTTCQYDGEFWNFILKDGNSWGHSPIGLNGGTQCWDRDFSFSDWSTIVHYCTRDGDLIGFAFGGGGFSPNLLKINDIETNVDGDKRSGADEDGGTIKDVAPGSEITLEIEIENLYSEETNIKLIDVIAKGIIKKIDDGDDIEEESDEENIRAGDKETIELEFEIPLEVKDKSYNLEVTIEGKDEKGIKYKQMIEFKVDVEKEKHDITIKAELTNPILKCSRTTGLNLNIVNMGTNDEDVVLKIINDELELNEQLSFELDDDPFDSDSKYSNSVIISVDKEQEASIYLIRVRADYSSKTTEKTVELEVKDCEGGIGAITGESTLQQTNNQDTTEKNAAKETDSNNNSRFLAVFLMGLLIVVIFGGLLVVKLFGQIF